METLKKVENPKIIEQYELGDWKVTIIEKNNAVSDEPSYEFYLTGNSITIFMFGFEKSMLEVSKLSLEELIINNLPDNIAFFKDMFDKCDELENPFAE